MRRLLILLVLLASPARADWTEIREADQKRLTNLSAMLGGALRHAMAEGDSADLAVLTEVLRGRPIPEDLAGDWRCRTLKIGGLLALTVYGNFECRITQTGPNEWYLEKTTGSQRTRGVIRADDGFMAYLGVGYVGGAPAVDYADLPATQIPVEPNQTIPVIGVVEQTSANSARILMPAPLLESRFDILYLTR